MGEVLRSPVTGNAIVLTPRSGSHSLASSALAAWYPDAIVPDGQHPAGSLTPEAWNGEAGLGLIVRNPIERFRSMCAHRPSRTIDEHLDSPAYGPLPQGDFARYFKFESELDAAAEWLGLPTPLPHEDASDEADKPTLTPEQEARVREIYADDVALWESLQ
jgi:hypothetical protein